MIISHNMMAMNANRMYNLTSVKQKKSTEKLSSGYKINRAADDAAGLAISEKMRRQIRGLTQASANCQDGISLVQIADGAMAELAEMLHRGTELSVKAANGTLVDEDRSYIQKEIEQIKQEINSLVSKTTFNEIPVLRGQPVVESEPQISGSMPTWASSSELGSGYLSGSYTTSNGETHAAAVIDFSGFTGSASDFAEIASGDKGFNTTCATCNNHYTISFTTNASKAGIVTSGQHYIYTVDISGCQNGKDISDRIMAATGGNPNGHFTQFNVDSDGKLIMFDERLKNNISPQNATFKQGIAVAKAPEPFDIVIQAGAEVSEGNQIEIQLPTVDTDSLGITSVSVATQNQAKYAIGSFERALSHVSTERSRMGAYQNRLEHTVRNLDNIVENTTAAESSIRDTDMANEMVAFSNNNIIAQAGQAMLAQANQSKQGVLSLLN